MSGRKIGRGRYLGDAQWTLAQEHDLAPPGMADFHAISGLDLNMAKCELYAPMLAADDGAVKELLDLSPGCVLITRDPSACSARHFCLRFNLDISILYRTGFGPCVDVFRYRSGSALDSVWGLSWSNNIGAHGSNRWGP